MCTFLLAFYLRAARLIFRVSYNKTESVLLFCGKETQLILLNHYHCGINLNFLIMNITTKSYESLLPFLVVEAITSQNSSFQAMSVRMMDRGWAWLVSGRKLLVWKFKESKSQNMTTRARRTLSPCFELQLPQSDLIHKAELTNVFFMPQNPNTSLRAITVPAALSVSPEGIIRFWSSIANERFTESSVVDMQGQEFCTLCSLSPLEYLLGTTTGSVYLLTIDATSNDQRGIIVCSSLAAPSGILSGISRRMTNLFFGPIAPDANSESRRPLIAVARMSEKLGDTQVGDRTFFVLSSSFKLRQWARTNEGANSQNQLIREWDLHKNIDKKLSSALCVNDYQQLEFWPVDMVSTRSKELLMLVVSLDVSRNNTINYATIVFNPYQAGDRLSKTTILRSHSWPYTNESEEQLLALRFVERCVNSPLCFMYDRKFLFLVQVDQDIIDAIDYGNQDDGILGAGFVDDQPLLFTQRDGLINSAAVRSHKEDDNEDGNNQTRNCLNSTLNSTRPFVSETIHEDTQMTTDAVETSELRNQSQSEPVERQKDVSAKPLNQSNKENSAGEVDFTSSKEFEWIQHIDNKRYGLASEVLARLAEESELLKDRRDTLLALSKLARIAE